jgi:hypothetical protein
MTHLNNIELEFERNFQPHARSFPGLEQLNYFCFFVARYCTRPMLNWKVICGIRKDMNDSPLFPVPLSTQAIHHIA